MIMFLLEIIRNLLIGFWFFFRPVLGWFLIVVGLIGMPMPIVNGLIFLVMGLALVGPRNRVVRWRRVHIKLLLERWARMQIFGIGPLGRLAQRSAQQISRQHRRMRWWFIERRARRQAALAQQQAASPKLLD